MSTNKHVRGPRIRPVLYAHELQHFMALPNRFIHYLSVLQQLAMAVEDALNVLDEEPKGKPDARALALVQKNLRKHLDVVLSAGPMIEGYAYASSEEPNTEKDTP